MERKMKITENGKYTLQDVKYGEENRIGGKFRNVHCRTWNMARKLKIMENEKYTLQDVTYGEENRKKWTIQKCPLQDLEYGKITENVDHE